MRIVDLIDNGDMLGMMIFAVWFALSGAGLAAGLWWSVRTWRRRGELNAGMKLAAGLAATSAIAGSFGTLVGLVKAAAATGGEMVDPSQRARMLGEGIASAMNCTAAGLSLWLLGRVALVLLAKQRKA